MTQRQILKQIVQKSEDKQPLLMKRTYNTAFTQQSRYQEIQAKGSKRGRTLRKQSSGVKDEDDDDNYIYKLQFD